MVPGARAVAQARVDRQLSVGGLGHVVHADPRHAVDTGQTESGVTGAAAAAVGQQVAEAVLRCLVIPERDGEVGFAGIEKRVEAAVQRHAGSVAAEVGGGAAVSAAVVGGGVVRLAVVAVARGVQPMRRVQVRRRVVHRAVELEVGRDAGQGWAVDEQGQRHNRKPDRRAKAPAISRRLCGMERGHDGSPHGIQGAMNWIGPRVLARCSSGIHRAGFVREFLTYVSPLQFRC